MSGHTYCAESQFEAENVEGGLVGMFVGETKGAIVGGGLDIGGEEMRTLEEGTVVVVPEDRV